VPTASGCPGHPVIEGGLGWLECAIEAEHLAGDHVIVICRVLRLDILEQDRPLIFYRGKYGRFEAAAAEPAIPVNPIFTPASPGLTSATGKTVSPLSVRTPAATLA
jgi:hypothetical protein